MGNRGMEFMEDWNKKHTSSPSFDDAIDWADSHPISRWINIKNKLPEIGDEVLATDGNYTHLCKYREENDYDAKYRRNHDPNYCANWLNLDSAVHYFQGVIAWMPVPKYK